MLTPSEYKKRYENIDVELKNGTTVTVAVNKYRLAPANVNIEKWKAFNKALANHGIDTSLRIDTGEGITRIGPRVPLRRKDLMLTRAGQNEPLLVSASPHDLRLGSAGLYRDVRSLGDSRADRLYSPKSDPHTRVVDWDKLAWYVFKGKGTPEACQAVLQLAHFWDLAPNLQAYADSALGLDCNGFVGNYLWHVKNEHPWTELGYGDLDLGADSPIQTGYYDYYNKGNNLLDRWESFDTTKTYIMMRVDDHGFVINGGDNNPGHIVITEPNKPTESRTGADGKKSFAVWVVEATGGHTPEGLWESWYSCRSYDSKTKVFKIFREGMDPGHQEYSFKIAAVS